jgi:hypothetical protein
MLLKEMMYVCSENHTKPLNPALCGQNVKLMKVKAHSVYTTVL